MIYLICTLVILFVFVIIILLGYADSKIDYSTKDIVFYFYNDNGFYIRVPCLFWQANKYKQIKKRFSDVVEYGGKEYTVTAILNSQPHLSQPSELLPSFFYSDFIANIEFKRNENSRSITNTTQIIGNNNTVIIEQNEINTITNNIDKLLQDPNLDDIDKQCLELFKYKLKQNSVSSTDTKRVLSVLDKLSKYAPYASLASSVINLIKSLCP